MFGSGMCCPVSVGRPLWREVSVRGTLRLSVSQYVLVSSPLCGRLTRYCFLFKSLGLEFVLSLWGALSDESLFFVSQSHFTADSQSVSQYVLMSSPLCGRLTRYCFLYENWVWNFLSCLCGAPSLTRAQSQGHFTAVSQSLRLGIEPTLWTFNQILLPLLELGLEFVVLSLWGALSDERPGLSFEVTVSSFVCVYIYYLHFCFSHIYHILIYIYTHTIEYM
jgi:hypothetical protein